MPVNLYKVMQSPFSKFGALAVLRHGRDAATIIANNNERTPRLMVSSEKKKSVVFGSSHGPIGTVTSRKHWEVIRVKRPSAAVMHGTVPAGVKIR